MATGHLSAWTFGSRIIDLPLIEVVPPESAVVDIGLPHLGLALGSNIPYEPGELVEGGEYELTFADDNNTHIRHGANGANATVFRNVLGFAQTMTWTKPPSGVLTNGATVAFSGYVKSAQPQPYVTGQRATIKVKIKVAGNETKTAGS